MTTNIEQSAVSSMLSRFLAWSDCDNSIPDARQGSKDALEKIRKLINESEKPGNEAFYIMVHVVGT